MSLQTSIKRNRDGVQLRMRGVLDERTRLADAISDLPRDVDVIIDLSGVERINSFGVREWISFLRLFEGRGGALVLEGCSLPIVAQMAVVQNFLGPARVRSFYAPYLCRGCKAESVELIEVADLGRDRKLPPRRCRCGGTSELDAFDTFTAFLGERA